MLNPMRDKKEIKGRTGGGREGTTPVTTACLEAEKKEREKNNR